MRVRKDIKLDKYGWNIHIYYTVDEGQKSEIMVKLYEIGCEGKTLMSIRENLENSLEDTGFTYTSYNKRCSILVIHKASSIGEFINTLNLEKHHLKIHICEALDINPYSWKSHYMDDYINQIIHDELLYSMTNL